MRIEPLLLLACEKIKEDISFRLSTFTLFIQPVLWLSIFLFLRETHVSVETKDGTIRYIDFLIIGIFVWRIISFIMGKLSISARVSGSVLRAIAISPSGKRILLASSIISTLAIAMMIGACILFTGVLIYNFSVYLNQIILASFVLFLIIIIHTGIAIVIISSPLHIKDAKSVGFITTTVIGLLSGVFFPVELFPSPMNDIAYMLPLTQGLALLRELTLFSSVVPNWNLFYALIAEAIAFFIIGLILYERSTNNILAFYQY